MLISNSAGIRSVLLWNMSLMQSQTLEEVTAPLCVFLPLFGGNSGFWSPPDWKVALESLQFAEL